MPQGAGRDNRGRRGCSTSRWGLVGAAGKRQDPRHAADLADPCKVSWYPAASPFVAAASDWNAPNNIDSEPRGSRKRQRRN